MLAVGGNPSVSFHDRLTGRLAPFQYKMFLIDRTAGAVPLYNASLVVRRLGAG